MNYGVYAIYNSLSETYDGLFLFRTELSARFELTSRMPEEKREFNTIYRIGSFDIVNGCITPSAHPTRVDYYRPVKAEVQTPLDSGSPEEQQNRFVERTSDIGVSR